MDDNDDVEDENKKKEREKRESNQSETKKENASQCPNVLMLGDESDILS